MKIVLNDANILIDVIHIELIDVLFKISHLELKTTDFVFSELHEDQKLIIQEFVDSGNLIIIESNEEDLNQISGLLSRSRGLSFEDCSVWYFAKFNGGILLTGDGALRKKSANDGVEVRGILFVFDQLLLANLITFEFAILKINQLYNINERLPQDAKYIRLDLWRRAEHIT